MNKSILVTGANGEIGHGLIQKLSENSSYHVIALDINHLDESIASKVNKFVAGDILDDNLIKRLFDTYKFDVVFHLAALLSTSSEKDPIKAHNVNTNGAINILYNAEKFSERAQKKVVFVFPSSIAIYGLPDAETKKSVGKIKEWQYNTPATMYGCNKIYIELLGNYYQRYYEKSGAGKKFFEFRSVRFPGIISADTIPSGGTSDFGPEMLHAAAQNKNYECFVRADTEIPFMVLPDAIKALLLLAFSPNSNVKNCVYNVGSFSLSAEKISEYAKELLHPIKVTYKPHQKRQAIVDSWPIDVDDSLARKDWGWRPEFNQDKAFKEYLIPAIKSFYS